MSLFWPLDSVIKKKKNGQSTQVLKSGQVQVGLGDELCLQVTQKSHLCPVQSKQHTLSSGEPHVHQVCSGEQLGASTLPST